MTRLICAAAITFALAGCQLTDTLLVKNTVNANSATHPKYSEYVQSGQLLPITSVINVEGTNVDLSNPEKKKLVVLFATWCSDSNRALKALNESPLLNDDNVEVIAIAREETKEQVIEWRDKHNINVPLAVDPERKIYAQFAEGGIPRFVTVSRDNKIIKMNLAEDENQLNKIVWM